MQIEFIFAGFGGQGVLTMGKFVAQAGMDEGKEVCWMPAYGPEMRGGTCNCTVVLSDRRIGSPIIGNPRVLVAMNLPSLDKFESAVVPGGSIMVNSSLIERECTRTDVDVYRVPANQMAIEIGNPKVANTIVLGALIGSTEMVKLETVRSLVEATFSKKKGKGDLVGLNFKALEAGYELGRGGAK